MLKKSPGKQGEKEQKREEEEQPTFVFIQTFLSSSSSPESV